jgi:hypothetical protein
MLVKQVNLASDASLAARSCAASVSVCTFDLMLVKQVNWASDASLAARFCASVSIFTFDLVLVNISSLFVLLS